MGLVYLLNVRGQVFGRGAFRLKEILPKNSRKTEGGKLIGDKNNEFGASWVI